MADSCSLLSKSLTQVMFVSAMCLFVVGIEKREVETKMKKRGGAGVKGGCLKNRVGTGTSLRAKVFDFQWKIFR